MLNRQKSLTYMIRKAGRPVRRLELTKWSFLLAHDMPSRGGPSFYQFVPYRLGPFSFCLYQEVAALIRSGRLAETRFNGRGAWRSVEDADCPGLDLAQVVQDDIVRVVERFKDASAQTLLDYVYRRFPWYTVNSNRQRLEARPAAAPKVFTAGYEGWQVDGFLNLLIQAGVRRVLDVRNNPVSRRYGFHRSTLSRLCADLEIEYVHFPVLGIQSELRSELRSPTDREALLAWYERETLRTETAALEKVAALMAEKPSVLMCAEAEPSRCHRSRLAKVISRMTLLRVRDLGAVHEAWI